MSESYDAYQSASLTEHARKNAAIGAVMAAQGDSPILAIPSTLTEENMVDVGNTVWAVVKVVPTGGDCVFRIQGISNGDTDRDIISLRNCEEITAAQDEGVKEVVNVRFEELVGVEIVSGTATSIKVQIIRYEGGEAGA